MELRLRLLGSPVESSGSGHIPCQVQFRGLARSNLANPFQHTFPRSIRTSSSALCLRFLVVIRFPAHTHSLRELHRFQDAERLFTLQRSGGDRVPVGKLDGSGFDQGDLQTLVARNRDLLPCEQARDRGTPVIFNRDLLMGGGGDGA